MFDCLGYFLSFALDFANPEISHFKITAEYSHKYIKVELNWIISFPCAVEFLSFHFRWLSINVHVHVHEWVCMQFSGRKMPPLFFRLSLIYWFKCSYFVPRRKTRTERERQRESIRCQMQSIYLSACLSICLFVCLCVCVFVHEHEHCLNTSSWIKASAREYRCAIGIAVCARHI